MRSTEWTLRPGRPSEAAALSALALRSKGHWGYDSAFLEACREELTIRPQWCDGVRLTVAERSGMPVGFARLAGDPPHGELAELYVDPSVVGRGLGTRLLAHAVVTARRLGFERLAIDADPFAEPFYLRAGAVRVGESPSGSIPGRTLPRLELDLRKEVAF